MNELVLPTKFYYPKIPPGYIGRPRLTAQLNGSLNGKLTLISAPAGFGKTTLLAGWVGQQKNDRESPIAWLSLDEKENDLIRFLTYLVTAVQKAAAPVGRSALTRLRSPQPVRVEAILTLLINDLIQLDGKLRVILDDYHLIRNPAIHTAVAFLLEYAPPQLHLVIASRSDPPLSLSRWRVRGELNEIRASDLRFTAGETTQFLQQALGYLPPDTTTSVLTQRTEGWPAGLQLAALSLQGLDASETARFTAGFDGTDRYIFAYLVEEVLQRQPPTVQNFLLQTTLLDRLTAPLCEAVTQMRDWPLAPAGPLQPPVPGFNAQEILQYLATNNLFLISLDNTSQWFRYYALFAETLQARLQESQPELIPVLHHRASHWYAVNGFTEQAIHHALAAHDTDMAADLIASAANHLWPQGHLGLLLSWLNALPEETLCQRLHLCLLHGWLLFLSDRWPEASQRIHQAGQQLAALPGDAPEIRQQRGRWAAIQGAMAAHRHHAAEAITWMETSLENLPPDDVHWQHVAMIGLGLAQLAEGQAHSAINTFHQAALACERVGDIYLAFAAWWHQAEAGWAQGHLHLVAECWRRLELLAERDEDNWLALRANAGIGQGMLAYERNELAPAKQLLESSLPQMWPGGQPRIALQAYLTLARLAQAETDLETMQAHLEAAGQLVSRFSLTAEQIVVAATSARLLLAEGQLLEAYWQLENEGIGPESPPDFQHEMGLLALVRLYLAERRTDEALAILARLLPAAELAGRDGSLLEICLLQALALAQHQQPDRALACLHRALLLAEPEQYGRVFIDEGRPLAQLLAQITPRTPYIAHLLSQMEGERAAKTRLDPLTARELEILALIAEGATNQAIADELVISLGTVKGHINHILSKLEAHNRTEAVARGRELKLL